MQKLKENLKLDFAFSDYEIHLLDNLERWMVPLRLSSSCPLKSR